MFLLWKMCGKFIYFNFMLEHEKHRNYIKNVITMEHNKTIDELTMESTPPVVVCGASVVVEGGAGVTVVGNVVGALMTDSIASRFAATQLMLD